MYKSSFFLYLVSISFSLNLSLIDYHDPAANHILDSEIINDILIVSGLIQGIEFYDISNNTLNHLTNFNLSNSGGGGGNTKSNCVRATNNYAYFTSNNGIHVVNISNPLNPQNMGSISGTNNLLLENLDLENNTLAVAAHQDGVKLFDISNPSSPQYTSTIITTNAWAVSIYNNYIYIANNDELIIASIENINQPEIISINSLGNAIKDLAIDSNFLYVALGSDGINIYDIANPINILYLDNYNTSTLANRITPFNGKLAIADWDDVEIIEWDGSSLNLVGYKNTGNRTMAISAKNNYIFSSEWASIQLFEFGSISGPDIDLDTWELNYPFVENGNSYSLIVNIINNGNQVLNIIDNYTTNSAFTITNPLNNLSPGESQSVEIVYNATNSNASGAYRIYSNDADEPEIICETNGNINGANIGQPAPDFNLEYLANGNGNFQLSDNLDQIIVLAFFSPM